MKIEIKWNTSRVFLCASTGLISLFLAACGAGKDDNLEMVYIDDGAIQCEFKGRSEQETAQILIDNGIDVLESGCGYLTGIEIAALCGLGDTNINLHIIHIENIPDARQLGYEPISSLSRVGDKGYEITECR